MRQNRNRSPERTSNRRGRASPRGQRARARFDGVAMVALAVLLPLPIWALNALTQDADWWQLLSVPLMISLVTFFAYRSDKRSAESGAWRVPEATLQLLALLGGWPGALLAQRMFRHKTSKRSFQVVFWVIVALHEFLALDAILGWRYTSSAWRVVMLRAG